MLICNSFLFIFHQLMVTVNGNVGYYESGSIWLGLKAKNSDIQFITLDLIKSSPKGQPDKIENAD